MSKKTKYYLVEEKALPDIVLRVLHAKELIDQGKARFVSDAVKEAGISRSAYYKYHMSVKPFFEYEHHRTVTIGLNLFDNPGVLGEVLNLVASFDLNLLTINQTIPINRVANVTLTIDTLEHNEDLDVLIQQLEANVNIRAVTILARE